jgi:hypothetical protein
MATPTGISFLKAQLIHVQHLLQLVADHPLMSTALTCRENELKEQLYQADECIRSDWPTPRSPENHARQIRNVVDRCPHGNDPDNIDGDQPEEGNEG